MGAPVITVPQAQPIAARPRCEALYDTELYRGFSAVTLYPFFSNNQNFIDPSGASNKSLLDTNMLESGQLPRGHYFRWFGLQSYLSLRSFIPMTAAAIEGKRQLMDSAFASILLGPTPYLYVPFTQVHAGTGLNGPLSTGQAGLTVGDTQIGWGLCCCGKDMTVPAQGKKPTPQGVKLVRVPRVPIEFAETENFVINLNVPQKAALPANIFVTLNMLGVYLKPLAA